MVLVQFAEHFSQRHCVSQCRIVKPQLQGCSSATLQPHIVATEPLAEWPQSAAVFRTFNYVCYNPANHVLMKSLCFVAYWSLLLLSASFLGRLGVLWHTSVYKLTVTCHYFYYRLSFLTHPTNNKWMNLISGICFDWYFMLYLNSLFCLESFTYYLKHPPSLVPHPTINRKLKFIRTNI